jgi:PEGA domain
MPQAEDGLDAFGSEDAAAPQLFTPAATLPSPTPTTAAAPRAFSDTAARAATWILIASVSAAVASAGAWLYQRRAAANAIGTLTIQTSTPGADVFIGGKLAGKTPLTTSLAAGAYDVRLAADGQSRDFKVALAGGTSTVRDLEFPVHAVVTPAVATGALHVQTDLKQAVISVDGVDRGTSPLTVDGLPPGDHHLVVRGDRGTFRRVVQIKAQETLSLMISSSEPTAVVPGWLTVTSPVPMQLREDGRLIGTTEADRLMLPSGDHDIELLNDALGYRVTRKITVMPGKTTATTIEPPSALLSVNALPWAEVWIDGERIGETPLANVSRRIGSHQVVFRHPQFGERTESVLLTMRQPTRIGVDMRKQ